MPRSLIKARWGSDQNEIDVLQLDKNNNTLLIENFAHYKIHAALHWTAFIQDGSVASGSKLSFSFKTPDSTTLAHFIVETRSSGEAITALLESASSTADGNGEVAAPAINRNRDTDGVSTLLEDTTTGSFNTAGLNTYPESVPGANHPTGTLIDCYATGSGNKSGGISRSAEEFVLKRATVYGIVMESKAATNSMILKLDWYENINIH